jgi:carboxyl-terminal processing protease
MTAPGSRAHAEGEFSGQDLAHIASLFQKFHYRQEPLDPTRSEWLVRHFITQLDPHRAYFLASDVSDFLKARDTLAQQLASGNIELPLRIHQRLVQRGGSG